MRRGVDFVNVVIRLGNDWNFTFVLSRSDTMHLTLRALRCAVVDMCQKYRELGDLLGDCDNISSKLPLTYPLYKLSSMDAAVSSVDGEDRENFTATLSRTNQSTLSSMMTGSLPVIDKLDGNVDINIFAITSFDEYGFILEQNAAHALTDCDVWMPANMDQQTIYKIMMTSKKGSIMDDNIATALSSKTIHADDATAARRLVEGEYQHLQLLLLPDIHKPDEKLRLNVTHVKHAIDSTGKQYTNYVIECTQGCHLQWNVVKRYNDFIILNNDLLVQARNGTDSDCLPLDNWPVLPGKQLIQSILKTNQETIETERKKQLTLYLQSLLYLSFNIVKCPNYIILKFLGILSTSVIVPTSPVSSSGILKTSSLSPYNDNEVDNMLLSLPSTDGISATTITEHEKESQSLLSNINVTSDVNHGIAVDMNKGIASDDATPFLSVKASNGVHQSTNSETFATAAAESVAYKSYKPDIKRNKRATLQMNTMGNIVKPGDILLFRCSSTAAGLQRAATGKEFDHTAIVVHTPLPRYVGGVYAMDEFAGNSKRSSRHSIGRMSTTVTDDDTDASSNNNNEKKSTIDYDRILSKLNRSSLCLLEATSAGVTVLPIIERLNAYEFYNCCDYICLRRLHKTINNGTSSSVEVPPLDARTLFRLNSFVVASEQRPYKFKISSILFASRDKKSISNRNKEKEIAQTSTSTLHASHSPSSSTHRVDAEGWSVFGSATNRYDQNTEASKTPSDLSSIDHEPSSITISDVNDSRVLDEKGVNNRIDSSDDEAEVELANKSFFCSALTAATLKVLHILPASLNEDYFWPGSFASGAEMDDILSNNEQQYWYDKEIYVNCTIPEIDKAVQLNPDIDERWAKKYNDNNEIWCESSKNYPQDTNQESTDNSSGVGGRHHGMTETERKRAAMQKPGETFVPSFV